MKKILLFIFLFTTVKSFSQTTLPVDSSTGKNIPCEVDDIKKKEDKFTGKISYSSKIIPCANDQYPFIMFSKLNEKIYISIILLSENLTMYKKGVILLLDNGKKIEKPEEDISVKASKGHPGFYQYSVFFDLTENEVLLLQSSRLTDLRLYIYDESIDENAQEKIKNTLHCISQIK